MDAPHFGAQRTEVSSLKPLYEECHVQMELKGPRCLASLPSDPPREWQCLSKSMGIRITGLGDFNAYCGPAGVWGSKLS